MKTPSRKFFKASALTLLIGALLFSLGFATAMAGTPAGYAEYIIPFDEDVFAYITSPVTNPDIGVNDTSFTLISVTAWSDTVTVYVDHWENGYGYDENAPHGPGTDEEYSIDANQTLNFNSLTVPRPRTGADGNTYIGAAGDCVAQPTPTLQPLGIAATASIRTTPNYCYDGRDRIITVGGATTVTRGGYFNTGGIGKLAAIGEEVFPLAPQLTKYILPFGEDVARNDFQRVFAIVQATEDNTIIQLDFNGDGRFDWFNTENGYRTARVDPLNGPTLTLQRGEQYILDRDSDGVAAVVQNTVDPGNPYTGQATLNKGTVILSNKTVQVMYFYGAADSTFNTRATAAFPNGFWGKDYYLSADGATQINSDALIYNPNTSAITIDWSTNSGAGGSFSVPANTTTFFQAATGIYIPDGSGLYLHGSGTFWGTSDIDTNGQNWDWGYSMLPGYLASDDQTVAWAPGNSPTQACNTANARGNGLFVTPLLDNTIIFIDTQGDGTPDTNPSMEVLKGTTPISPTGFGYKANRLESLYITGSNSGALASSPCDMTGARIYATGPFVMSFGENPDRTTLAGGLDLGYTVLPSPQNWMDLVLTVDKSTSPALVSTTPQLTPVTFTLVVDTHEFPLNTVSIVDTLPADWEFVPGFTTITYPDLSTGTTDPTLSGVGNRTLTWPTSLFPSGMQPNQKITITFRARTTAASTFVDGDVTQNKVLAIGTRTVGGVTQTFKSTDFVFNYFKSATTVTMAMTKTSSVPEPTPVSPGDTLTYTVNIQNPVTSNVNLTGVTLLDPMPVGVTYVAASGSVTCELAPGVADNFATNGSYAGNDGPTNWNAAWTETNDNANAATGTIQVVSNQARFIGNGTANRSINRIANVTGQTAATISFNMNDLGFDGGETLVAEYSIDGGAFVTIGTLDGAAGYTGSNPLTVTLNGNTTLNLRFRAPGTWNAAGDIVSVDNVRISFDADLRKVTDGFAAVAYTNNGPGNTTNWAGNWTETDTLGGGAASGLAQVTGGALRLSRAQNVRDEFAAAAYTNNGPNNTANWAAAWTETDTLAGGAASGLALVTGNALRLGLAENVRDEFAAAAYNNNGANNTANWVGNWVEKDIQAAQTPGSGYVLAVAAAGLRLQFVTSSVADVFTTNVYTRNDGTFQWSGNWTETGDDANPAAGFIQSDNGNNNRLNFGSIGAGNLAVGTKTLSRTAPVTGGSVTFAFTLSDQGVDANEGVIAEYQLDAGGFTELQRITDATITACTCTVSTAGASTITLRFRAFDTGNNRFENNDNVGIDDVSITFNNAVGASAYRQVNLAGITGAPYLSFTPTAAGGLGVTDQLVLECSTDATFAAVTTLATFSAATPDVAGPWDLTPCASATTAIRFRISANYATNGESITFANIDVSYRHATFTAAQRVVNLAGATSAFFSFTATPPVTLEGTDTLVVEVSTGGGFTTLATYNGGTPTVAGPYDISAFISATTNIRFRITGGYEISDETMTIDDVDVSYTTSQTSVQRTVNLTGALAPTLSFATAAANLEAGDTLVVEASTAAAGPFTTLATYTAGTPSPAGPYDLTSYISANTTIQFRTTGGYQVSDESFSIDDVSVSWNVASTPIVPTTFPSADPPQMLAATKGCRIRPNQSMTVTFNVTVDSPFPTGSNDIVNIATTGANEIPVPLTDDARNIVVVPSAGTATVGDRVWFDADRDGVFDPGENGIPGVQLTLKDQFGTPLKVTTTDSLGRYLFQDVVPGNGYYVEITNGLPGGLTQTTDTVGDPFNTNGVFNGSNGTLNWLTNWTETGDDANAATGNITIANSRLQFNGGAALAANDEIRRSVTVTGATSIDIKYDWGGPNVGTALAAGDQIAVEWSTNGSTWTTLRTLSTAAAATFTDTVAWTPTNDTLFLRYRAVNAIATVGKIATFDNVQITFPQTGRTAGFNLSAGQNYIQADLGYRASDATAVIGDFVWSDADSDQLQDAGEPGLSGVTVELYAADANGLPTGLALQTAVTDATGHYLFSGIPANGANDYVVTINASQGPLTGYTATTGTLSYYKDLPSGAVRMDADFGFVNPSSNFSIKDGIWLDNGTGVGGVANDGSKNGTEVGIAGVTVDLYNASGVIVATTTSASDGTFAWSGIPGGQNYKWKITDVFGVLNDYFGTTASALSGQYQLTGNLTANLDYTAAIALDQFNTNGSFTGSNGTIGWLTNWSETGDTPNGVANSGTTQIANNRIEFRTGTPANATIQRSATVTGATSIDVQYVWSQANLTAGNDRMIVEYSTDGVTWNVIPSRTINAAATGTTFTDTLAWTPSNSTLFTRFRALDALEGTDLVGFDNVQIDAHDIRHFGYNVTRSIGDTVFNDSGVGGGTINNGVQDGTEPGISGVTVQLYRDVDNDGVFEPGVDDGAAYATQVTDSLGHYLFAGLPSGSRWFVTIDNTQPTLTGFTRTTADNSGVAGDQLFVTPALTGSANRLDIDFGYRATTPRTISGRFFNDINRNGIDNTEAGFQSVTVELVNASNVVIATTTSAANGSYSFAGLADNATYTVRVTDTSSVLSTYETTRERTEGALAASYNALEVVALAGADVTNVDFGYYKTSTLVTRATVTSFVARDMGGSVAIEWETTAEMGTVGFFLKRFDESKQEYVQVNEKLLPSVLTPHGGVYRYIDPVAVVGKNYRYRLIEVEAWGHQTTKGPFNVNAAVTTQMDSAAMKTQSIEPDPRPTGFAAAARVGRNPQKNLEKRRERREAAQERRKARFGDAARLSLIQQGAYYVSVRDFVNAGLSVDRGALTGNRNMYSLANQGSPVPFTVSDDGNGIVFYGQELRSPFAKENVYWFATDGAASPRMKERRDTSVRVASGTETFTRTLHMEEDFTPAPGLFTDAGSDFWFWDYAYAGEGPKAFSFRTDGVKASGSASIVVRLKGGSDTEADPDHHALFRLNGQTLGDVYFDGVSDTEQTIQFDASLLIDGVNSFEFEAVADTQAPYSLVYLDSFDVVYTSYYRAYQNRVEVSSGSNSSILISGFTRPDIMVFDVTKPKAPVRVTGTIVRSATGGYGVALAPRLPNTIYSAVTVDALQNAIVEKDVKSDLRNRNNRAQYLIITNDELAATAQTLADYRSDLTSMVVDIEDVYDEFSAGIKDPNAIRSFLTYAQSEWRQKPKYVLLAGDGTWDYKDSLGLGAGVIPPMMVSTPTGIFPSDTWFANVDGGVAPEVAIGRLPAATPEELAQMIAKIQARENATGDWLTRAIMASDNSDDAGDFPTDSTLVTSALPAGSNVTRISLADMSGDEARTRLIDAINQGAGIVNYIGHGGYWVFADEGMFWSGDEQYLTNATQSPVMTAMTCLVANFGLPWVPSVGEQLVRKDQGGVAALWAPTGEAENDLSVSLAETFYKTTATGATRLRIGDAIQKALKEYEKTGNAIYIVEIYTLLGDPAMRLR